METIDQSAKIIWDYMQLHHEVYDADIVLVFGSEDVRIADRAVEVFKKGHAPYILFSGKSGHKSRGILLKSEAETMSDIARKEGVPLEAIFIEDQSTNTGENIVFSRALLERKRIAVQKIICVTKPYMERRVLASMQAQWPEVSIRVVSPNISYEEYMETVDSKEHALNLMVGDFYRIKEYPKLGFQVEQEIPEYVESAYEDLLNKGFDKFVTRK